MPLPVTVHAPTEAQISVTALFIAKFTPEVKLYDPAANVIVMPSVPLLYAL
jgi:hypothetical protein